MDYELKLIKGTVDSDLFFDFVRGDLLPQLQPFDGMNPHSMVILDNCSIHHIESIHEFFKHLGSFSCSYLHIVRI